MTRSRALSLFVLLAALLLGVMAWLTGTVRRLDRAERAVREQAALEESVRLALWRLDSLLSPWLAQESALPAAPSPCVRARLVWAGVVRPLHPEVDGARAPDLPGSVNRLALLSKVTQDWLPAAPAESAPKPKVVARPPEKTSAKETSRQAALEPQTAQQELLNTREFEARAQNVMIQQKAAAPVEMLEKKKDAPEPSPSASLPVPAPSAAPPPPARVTAVQPVWIGDELVLARRVRRGAEELVEGAWIDWPGLSRWLTDAIKDVLPEARLTPVRGNEADVARRLASLPVRLVPGRPAVAAPPGEASLFLPLSVAWSLTALALAALGSLLFGMATLGERREAFVSAVTHELRTPLTTFRMYTEMLAGGMVKEEAQRSEYLETLRREADRQTHLVENVLAYSRLERGRYREARETLTVRELLAHLMPTLSAQAERAGMTLAAPEEGPASDVEVAVDRAAVERILFNLVDNAGKYAKDAADRRIHLDCETGEREVLITVSDHGPGIGEKDARQLFRAFRKSARDAAHSAPGVGLGLALSRRLARAIGGELAYVPGSEGASFCLRLPQASR